MEIGNPETYKGVISFIVMFVLPFLVVSIYMVFKWAREDEKTYNDNTYYKHKDKTYLERERSRRIADKRAKSENYKSSCRKKPPNATFFGRIDGENVSVEGPPEEKFLNRIELIKWKLLQRREKKD